MTTINIFRNDLLDGAMLDAPPLRVQYVAFGGSSKSEEAVSASRWQTRSLIAVLATMSLIQTIFLFSFYAPASGGNDQNGYHVTARLLSQSNGTSFRPASPFSFIGNVMILTKNGRITPIIRWAIH